eukprot:1846211-Rhodomonas_salina.1
MVGETPASAPARKKQQGCVSSSPLLYLGCQLDKEPTFLLQICSDAHRSQTSVSGARMSERE